MKLNIPTPNIIMTTCKMTTLPSLTRCCPEVGTIVEGTADDDVVFAVGVAGAFDDAFVEVGMLLLVRVRPMLLKSTI
jgi:hypothetical protein